MSGFLIDTNVLSEYNRPGGPDAGVKRWLETTDRQSQHVSVITLAEIQKGIELLAEGKRRVQLRTVAEARPGSMVFWPHTSSGSSGGRSLGIAAGAGITYREIAAGGRLVDCRHRVCL